MKTLVFLTIMLLTGMSLSNTAFAVPYFVIEQPSGSLAIVSGRPTYDARVLAGPYSSISVAQSAFNDLLQLGQTGSLPLQAGNNRLAKETLPLTVGKSLETQANRTRSVQAQGRPSYVPVSPLSSVPFADLTDRLAAAGVMAETYPATPAYSELSSFVLSSSGPLSPIPLSPTVTLPSSIATSFPSLPMNVVPRSVPIVTVPPMPAPIFMSPLPLALGRR
ncbi:hypothetical protein Desti_2329 [Desulfomonile tiedjei DSM 6799]|uniref:Uncharacterized protein n=1 Tax=Desulfomonile tiedjei (strain ATCC 49306 / DSM 6799 / DCB-1) TaxID=706587 RepID=I4C625_DESTA|nr:hypothetical protein Desti_2329 [Desulfomonile tiedjei DSM 6799]